MPEKRIIALVIGLKGPACYRVARADRMNSGIPTWSETKNIFGVIKTEDWRLGSYPGIKEAAKEFGIRFQGLKSNEKLPEDVMRITINVKARTVRKTV